MITSDIGCGAHVYVMCMLTFVSKIAQPKNPFHFCLKAPLRFIWGSKAGRLLLFAARRVVSKRFL